MSGTSQSQMSSIQESIAQSRMNRAAITMSHPMRYAMPYWIQIDSGRWVMGRLCDRLTIR